MNYTKHSAHANTKVFLVCGNLEFSKGDQVKSVYPSTSNKFKAEAVPYWRGSWITESIARAQNEKTAFLGCRQTRAEKSDYTWFKSTLYSNNINRIDQVFWGCQVVGFSTDNSFTFAFLLYCVIHQITHKLSTERVEMVQSLLNIWNFHQWRWIL